MTLRGYCRGQLGHCLEVVHALAWRQPLRNCTEWCCDHRQAACQSFQHREWHLRTAFHRSHWEYVAIRQLIDLFHMWQIAVDDMYSGKPQRISKSRFGDRAGTSHHHDLDPWKLAAQLH